MYSFIFHLEHSTFIIPYNFRIEIGLLPLDYICGSNGMLSAVSRLVGPCSVIDLVEVYGKDLNKLGCLTLYSSAGAFLFEQPVQA